SNRPYSYHFDTLQRHRRFLPPIGIQKYLYAGLERYLCPLIYFVPQHLGKYSATSFGLFQYRVQSYERHYAHVNHYIGIFHAAYIHRRRIWYEFQKYARIGVVLWLSGNNASDGYSCRTYLLLVQKAQMVVANVFWESLR